MDEPVTIYITEFDRERLLTLLGNSSAAASDGEDARDLEEELERAEVVAPEEIPPDVITMNSRVRLTDLERGETLEYTLVFPHEADYDAGKISILAPIGTALLGYRVGHVIEWPVPAGVRRLRVEAILYQPEAAGDFDR
jgi:regulator of nucleoside diphosphate kinase